MSMANVNEFKKIKPDYDPQRFYIRFESDVVGQELLRGHVSVKSVYSIFHVYNSMNRRRSTAHVFITFHPPSNRYYAFVMTENTVSQLCSATNVIGEGLIQLYKLLQPYALREQEYDLNKSYYPFVKKWHEDQLVHNYVKYHLKMFDRLVS